ncbi:MULTISPECIES: hypothetical protein [unclassified Chamaesiphon]|nr:MULTISPECIES: hypothetical protein [unclassified Chamaesiphon]
MGSDARFAPPRSGGFLQVEGGKTGGSLQVKRVKTVPTLLSAIIQLT